MQQHTIIDFSHWRSVARQLRQRAVAPAEVQFFVPGDNGLFDGAGPVDCQPGDPPPVPQTTFRVPQDFLRLAENVGYHRSSNRWDLLYRVLWRLTHDEPELMQRRTDEQLHTLLMMEKAVRRDAHKMKAFVRFRKVLRGAVPHYIAWHRPDHLIVRKVAPFFSRRFPTMNWTILTRDESVTWDQQTLRYFPGVDRSHAPVGDELEELWKTYYAHTFNPARIKIKAMKTEMPVRHWATLPETQIIDQMLQDAPRRVETMVRQSEGFRQTARDFLPSAPQPWSLALLRSAIQGCRACDLHCHATQPVFGQGPIAARIVIVGEQPGDQEDQQGVPMVGPAGEVLNRALLAAGLDRAEIYFTNTVKHFKFEPTPQRRLHKKPSPREIRACLPWFEEEWKLLDAKVLVCLGATAATALISPGFRLHRQRGRWLASKYCPRTIASWHPAMILRQTDPAQRASQFADLVHDLRTAGLESERPSVAPAT